MAAPERLLTADDLLAMPEVAERYELVAGRLTTRPFASYQRGLVSSRLGSAVHAWAEEHALGATVGSNCGFFLAEEPDTVRAPDGAFIAAGRLPPRGELGYCRVMPDLLWEIAETDEHLSTFVARLADWLAAGVKVVWVFWPAEQVVQIWRSVLDIRRLEGDAVLTCVDLLPGFELSLAQVFA